MSYGRFKALINIFGQPLSFTILMSIMGISISTYYGGLLVLSEISMIIGLVTLTTLTVFLLLNVILAKRKIWYSYNKVDYMALISGVALTMIRFRLDYNMDLNVPLAILSIFYLIILFFTIREMAFLPSRISFKYHLMGVASVLISIGLDPIGLVRFLIIGFIVMGVCAYFYVSVAMVKRILEVKDKLKLIDGSVWIQMGLSALISVAFIRTGSFLHFFHVLALFFWILAFSLLPVVMLISIIKIVKSERKDLYYNPSSWSTVFPQAVFSTDTFIITRIVHLVFMSLLYYLSLAIVVSATSLWFIFLILGTLEI
ncbi:C4-dicarboxylate ABC transporter [Sulfolobus tengchongensis]|uniref:C4-dicarboxylate ABC transporter n=1 Tax=Sulfolobus tengchongensis TaxID=207809 RepID=A0AAX4L213_9CREN